MRHVGQDVCGRGARLAQLQGGGRCGERDLRAVERVVPARAGRRASSRFRVIGQRHVVRADIADGAVVDDAQPAVQLRVDVDDRAAGQGPELRGGGRGIRAHGEAGGRDRGRCDGRIADGHVRRQLFADKVDLGEGDVVKVEVDDVLVVVALLGHLLGAALGHAHAVAVAGQRQVVVVSVLLQGEEAQVGIRAEEDPLQLVVQVDGDVHRLHAAAVRIGGREGVVDVAVVGAPARFAHRHGHVHGLVVPADAAGALVRLHRVAQPHVLDARDVGVIAQLLVDLVLNQDVKGGVQRVGVRGEGVGDRARRRIAHVVGIVLHDVAPLRARGGPGVAGQLHLAAVGGAEVGVDVLGAVLQKDARGLVHGADDVGVGGIIALIDLVAGGIADLVVRLVGQHAVVDVGAGDDGLRLERLQREGVAQLAREHAVEVVLDVDVVDQAQAAVVDLKEHVAAVGPVAVAVVVQADGADGAVVVLVLLDGELGAHGHLPVDARSGDHQRPVHVFDVIGSARGERDFRSGGDGIRAVQRDGHGLNGPIFVHGFQPHAHRSVHGRLRRGNAHKQRRTQNREAAQECENTFHNRKILLRYADACRSLFLLGNAGE